MSSAHALIVDDSKTAQLRLKRMLSAYDLHVDVVLSAEEALAYLSYRAPAVIFLDQSMKGMDGIQALRTIKANPATATIPVIMYTSEQGAVFTGQARALGALDILYKSSLKPSSLEEVLSTLKIPPRKAQQVERQGERRGTPPPGKSPVSGVEQNSTLEETRAQVARLFEIHLSDVGRQIDTSTKFLARRINAAQEQNRNTPPPEIVVGDLPLSVLNEEVSAERRRMSLVANSLLCVLLAGLVTLGVFLWQLRYVLDDVAKDYQTAAALSEMNANQIQQLSTELYAGQAALPTQNKGNRSLFTAITWAANTDLGFDHGEEPLNEDLLNKFSHLLYLLDEAKYRGIVELRLGFGDTCLASNSAGELELAAADLPVNDCVFRKSLNEDLSETNYMSLPYRRFEQLSASLQQSDFDVMVSSVGLALPRVQYPPITNVDTAGQWNQIALQNNYVSVALHAVE